MTFDTILHTLPRWLESEGTSSNIVISSRARLARNLEGMLYAHRAEEFKLAEVVESVLEGASEAGFDTSSFFRNSGWFAP